MDFSSTATTPAGTYADQPEAHDGGAAATAMEVDNDDEHHSRRLRDEYISSVRTRIDTYEQCVDAIGIITASLEELSTKIEAMKTSTQQLNAFTSGWLTWSNMPKDQAAASAPAATTAVAARRQAWDGSTRLPIKNKRRAQQSDPRDDHTVDEEAGTSSQLPVRQQSSRGRDIHGAEQESRDTRRSHRCSSPTCQKRRLASADANGGDRHHRHHHRHPHDHDHDAVRSASPVASGGDPTRVMIERAFDTAMISSMLKSTATFTLDESVDSEHSAHDAYPAEATTTTRPPQGMAYLHHIDNESQRLRTQYATRREQREQDSKKDTTQSNQTSEFQNVMRSARFEYETRKLALQSLQARVQREIHFLETTAAELAQRETLMDESFVGYEQWARREFRVDSGQHDPHTGARAG